MTGQVIDLGAARRKRFKREDRIYEAFLLTLEATEDMRCLGLGTNEITDVLRICAGRLGDDAS